MHVWKDGDRYEGEWKHDRKGKALKKKWEKKREDLGMCKDSGELSSYLVKFEKLMRECEFGEDE